MPERMAALPPPLGDGALHAWRLDRQRHAESWDSGEGARLHGGRWNSTGVPAVYCAADPATAILEVAVHTGFAALDTVPHVLTRAAVDMARVHIVRPADVPNPNWLVPGIPGEGQQSFGDALLRAHGAFLIPSTVSRHSWNLILSPGVAPAAWRLLEQHPFALDTRLNPPRR